jgi:GGDEF domain-containing protein
VRNALRRAGQDSLTNPVTGLPEGMVVDERLGDCLNKEHWALVLVALENLDTFREQYGFVASDDVMRAVSLMIHNALREAGTPENFLGHLLPAEFLLMAEPGTAITLEERVRIRLEQSLDYFYPIKDRDQALAHKNRLAVKTANLVSGDRRFASVDEIKAELLQRKK